MDKEIKEREEKYSDLDTKLSRLHKRAKQRIQDVQKVYWQSHNTSLELVFIVFVLCAIGLFLNHSIQGDFILTVALIK